MSERITLGDVLGDNLSELWTRPSSTAALVIIARKIARVAYALFKHNTTFEPLRFTQGLT